MYASSPEAVEAARRLAPSGCLRAAINLGNPILAFKVASTGEVGGVSVDIARELARRLSTALDLVVFEGAGKVADAATLDVWDVAFLAIDPKRAADIDFTAPYVTIEGVYLAADGSAFRTIEDVDRPGVRISVGQASAYDLFLTRTLQHARIVRVPSSSAAIDLFVAGAVEIAAGIRQPLAAFAAAHRQSHVLPERFMAIEQAMGTPKRDRPAAAFLQNFIEELKATGFVADALARHRQTGATVAPASSIRTTDGLGRS